MISSPYPTKHMSKSEYTEAALAGNVRVQTTNIVSDHFDGLIVVFPHREEPNRYYWTGRVGYSGQWYTLMIDPD